MSLIFSFATNCDLITSQYKSTHWKCVGCNFHCRVVELNYYEFNFLKRVSKMEKQIYLMHLGTGKVICSVWFWEDRKKRSHVNPLLYWRKMITYKWVWHSSKLNFKLGKFLLYNIIIKYWIIIKNLKSESPWRPSQAENPTKHMTLTVLSSMASVAARCETGV